MRVLGHRVATRLPGVALAALCWLAFAATVHAAPLLDGGARRIGSKLSYAINSGAASHRFVATVLKAAPDVQFEWYTTSPVAADGVREVSATALAESAVWCECYRDREWGEAGGATALWLSRAVFASLSTGSAALVFNDGGGMVPLRRTLTLLRRDTFAVRIDGEWAEVAALVARSDSGTILWVRDDAADPLVLAAEGTWSLRLASIWQRRDDEVGRFVLVDGLGLHIVERGSTGEPPVLLLHGGPGMESNYFRPYLEPLEREHRLVYVDQPGQGLSERLPPNRRYSLPGAVAAIEAVRMQLGAERIVLLGHSYGGFVAQLYALAFPGRLAGLILVDTAPSYDWSVEANANIQRVGTPAQRFVPPGLSNDERIRRVFALYFDPPDPATAEAFMDRVILSAEAWRQLTATREFRSYDVRAELGRVAVPTLVLAGENDLITSANQARIIAAAIPGARLHLFPGTGHNPFVEEPAAFNAVVGEFLRGLQR